ncbi:MAG: MarR family transcriptional regulator [Spirochaetales bacterium]|nr:MarR family transcriptional regulator [Spirochaetales bacterium]
MESIPANMKVLYFFQGLSEDIQGALSKGAEGFTPTEIDLLINLATPLRMKDLAKSIYCLPSNVTVLVDKMEGAGLIERKRSTEDRRVIEVGLTEKGLESRALLMEKIDDVISDKSILDNHDFEEILGIISRKVDNS